jgi:hypothetical protein
MDEELKPLDRTLQRLNRCPGKEATTRNRVLRGRRATGAAKRTQGVQLLRDRASKAQSWERPPYANADAAPTRVVWPEREGPAGVKERGGLHT